MRVAVIGSRTTDLRHGPRVLHVFRKWFPQAELVVSGDARGADQFARLIARELELPLLLYLPNWERYGKRGGFERNTDIARECDICLAILSHPLSESRGSADTIRKCRAMGKRVVIIHAFADGTFRLSGE